MANDNEILRRIKDFIRGKGTPEDITYRWYNYFNAGCNKYLDIAKGKNTGCDFPESWLEGINAAKNVPENRPHLQILSSPRRFL